MADGLKIKCSSCGVDIDIAQLADHVCEPVSTTNDEPLPSKLDRAATFAAPSSFNNNNSTRPRSGRMRPPPRIDSAAANKPFQPQGPLSPESNYGSPKSLSPPSPGNGRQRFMMNRSATSPMPRQMAPPSPDLHVNMDCAFPPFPTSRSATPTSARPKPRERLAPPFKHQYAEASPMYAPLSPRFNGGEAVTKRLDSIAPGPFDGSDRRPSTADGRNTPAQKPEFGHRRTATQGSIKSVNQRTSLASNASRTSMFSNGSSGLPSRPKPGFNGVPAMPPPPPKVEEKSEGIDAFLERLQKETMRPAPLGPDSRSRTYPLRQESRNVVDPMPQRPRRPSDSAGPRAPLPALQLDNAGPRPNNMFPTRSTSRGGAKLPSRLDTQPLLPPLPSFGKDTPTNPLHTPSDSGLSDDSYSSAGFGSIASSRSSPPASETSGLHSRNVSKIGRSDDIKDTSIPRVASPDSFLDPRDPPRPLRRNEPTTMMRAQVPEPLVPEPIRPLFSPPLESPMDPAIHRAPTYKRRFPDSEKANKSGPVMDLGISLPPPPPPPEPEFRERPARRPTTASRGKCRGCSDPIVGKSIKDSSGRLTGRYHKQCFVCQTCGDPFPTADFYVFENFPYCEHHYHELNDSLCKLCNRGIEGQYLETDARSKFHPRCFTCSTCRIPLRDDYFEVGGRAFCERHAYAAQRSNMSLFPGDNRSRNMQKRRTRLMMM